MQCCRLDYPGIGPEHSYLNDIGRAEYYAVTDDEALEAFQHISRLEGIIPALETSHAFAYLKVCLTALWNLHERSFVCWPPAGPQDIKTKLTSTKLNHAIEQSTRVQYMR